MNWLVKRDPLVDQVEQLYWSAERSRVAMEIELLAQHAEYLKAMTEKAQAEAQVIKLENKKKAAEISLINEANERERQRLRGWSNVAIATYSVQTPVKGQQGMVNGKIKILLRRTADDQRKHEITVVNQVGASITNCVDVNAIQTFLEARNSYQMYIQPWLNNDITGGELRNVSQTTDVSFAGIEFVGAKKIKRSDWGV